MAGRLVARHTARPVLVGGLMVLVVSGLVMVATASPTMAVSVLVVATWLRHLGGFVTATPAADMVLSQAPPERAGSVAAVQPAFAMTGFALGPTVYILLLNLFFHKEWLADAESRGVSLDEAQDAANAFTHSMTGSRGAVHYDPNLLHQASDLALAADYTNGVRLTMLVVTLLPLTVAVVAHLVLRRRRDQRHHASERLSSAAGPRRGQPLPEPG